MTVDQRFRRREHLRRRSDFARVYAAGIRAGDGRLVVYVAENGLAWSRLGLSVSKRLGEAVHRNYVRRRIREVFRTSKRDIPEGLDIVCVATAAGAAHDARYDLGRAFVELVARAAKMRHVHAAPGAGPPNHAAIAERRSTRAKRKRLQRKH
ncbi:MAG: ribonuclease P protein component [Phycisphaerae bacterium]